MKLNAWFRDESQSEYLYQKRLIWRNQIIPDPCVQQFRRCCYVQNTPASLQKQPIPGQIAINFISEGYLYAVLDNIQSSATSSNPQQDELNQLVAAQSNPGQSVLGVSTPTDPTVTARIQSLAASLGPSGLDTAKSYSKKVQLGSIATTANFPNAVYQGGPFDIELDFTAGGRTVIRRLENCFPGIPLRPKPKTLRAGASRRPRVEGRSRTSEKWVMGKGRAGNRFRRTEREQNISDLASGSLKVFCGKTGSEGPIPYGSHQSYGGYEALLPLLGVSCPAG